MSVWVKRLGVAYGVGAAATTVLSLRLERNLLKHQRFHGHHETRRAGIAAHVGTGVLWPVVWVAAALVNKLEEQPYLNHLAGALVGNDGALEWFCQSEEE